MMLRRKYRDEKVRKLNERRAEARREQLKTKNAGRSEARAKRAEERRARNETRALRPPQGLVEELHNEGV
jgi:hypothetical protein